MTPRTFIAALALAGVAHGVSAQQSAAPPKATRAPTLYEDLQMFSQVLNQIRSNHPDSQDTHRLIMAAVEGMIRAADPHSYVLPVARLSADKARAFEDGKLYPVPIAFRFVGGAPVVAGIASGTEAARADILRGDELVAVDGAPVSAMSVQELEIGLAGAKGSTVRLTFARQRVDGSKLQITRVVKRQRAGAESSVPVHQMLDETTGYVRIVAFDNARVAEDVAASVRALRGAGMQRLVLDLRDNGGGLVDEAAAVAGAFLPTGATVYIAETRPKPIPDTVRVKRSFWRREDRYPIVVMVNDGTASASELLAGALQDHDRALVVGRPTFGKSLMMRGFPLTDGSVIVLVVGRVRTPCGRLVQREYRGITTREYYRIAGEARDTVGRASCLTSAGRTVYGGGGIYPDVFFAAADGDAAWLARIREQELPLKWVGGFLSGAGSGVVLDSLARQGTVDAGGIADFRAFAQTRGVDVPNDPTAVARLGRVLALEVAAAKWGDAGYYRVAAAGDPEIQQAVRALEQAPTPR
ncbi:MAG: S41 family peptidase [Gemmatimonadaceae bacterium]